MNIWTARKDLMEHFFLIKKLADAYYRHAKRIFKYFNNKNIGEYYNLYVQSKWYIIIWRCIWEFRCMCPEIYELDSAHFLSAPGLA